ncbi:hypothetical protein E4T52_04675 [Aureobasidium sp. EXF-3400]|nr:hypothetical protein E4T51_03755 [Aureobasidium sp. EXF-12344]KAI4780443.1 hypothetical protein E4T52_04675 [Aureobasidium sp. EXF-3400]
MPKTLNHCHRFCIKVTSVKRNSTCILKLYKPIRWMALQVTPLQERANRKEIKINMCHQASSDHATTRTQTMLRLESLQKRDPCQALPQGRNNNHHQNPKEIMPGCPHSRILSL